MSTARSDWRLLAEVFSSDRWQRRGSRLTQAARRTGVRSTKFFWPPAIRTRFASFRWVHSPPVARYTGNPRHWRSVLEFSIRNLYEAAVSSPRVRKLAHFSGNVQGVGFRYSTCSIAARFAVTGYVKNLADGRVELVVEGASSEVEALLTEMQQRMDRYIRRVQVQDEQATSEFSDFGIAY